MAFMRLLELEGDTSITCPGIIYLDMNIVVALRMSEDSGLTSIVRFLYDNGYVFPYSPAHIEEIAMVARNTPDEKDADLRVNNNLDFLARLSRHVEIIRGSEESDPTHFRRECPSDCMQRVLDHYWLTHLSEASAELVRAPLGGGTDTPCPPGILRSDSLTPFIIEELRKQGLAIDEIPRGHLLPSNHIKLQKTIDSLFNALSAAGFSREKKKKTRSAIHDVTHAIHGVLADFFVTDDARFRTKLKAVYDYFEAKTEVLSKSEFLSRFGCDSPI